MDGKPSTTRVPWPIYSLTQTLSTKTRKSYIVLPDDLEVRHPHDALRGKRLAETLQEIDPKLPQEVLFLPIIL